MAELRFDGRVAIVTGAGRGLGRAYAHLLAARGARVVVNDADTPAAGTTPSEPAVVPGASPRETTAGSQAVGAQAVGAPEVGAPGVGAPGVGGAAVVAGEIAAAGGVAVADGSDVATEAGAAAVVQAALDAFGRVDAVIANAGIMRWARFPDVPAEDLEAHLAVHVRGSFLVTRAAWPHLVAQGDGRVVTTVSTGMLGLPGNAAYATAKAGVLGLTRALAVEGRKHGIAVNAIAPAATTRMAGDGGPDLPPEQVAPMVAYLAHESCPVTGEVLTAGGGRFARLFLGSTPGWVHDGPAPTVEDVAAHWDAITDEGDYAVPADLTSWSTQFLSHLPAED